MSAVRNDLNLAVTRVFDAPVALVWEVFTRPEHLVHWWMPENFLPPVVLSMDVRPGGKWRYRMPLPDGKSCMAYGVYKEVVPRERLSWDDYCDDFDGKYFHKAFVTVSFEDLGGKTRVTVRGRLDPPADRDPKWTVDFMEKGWSGGWKDNLEKVAGYLPRSALADRAIVVSREYDAPRELVWETFTDAEHVKNWWGPNGFTTTTFEHDLRPGGAWRFVMHGPDGTDYPNFITYLAIRKPEELVYAHGTSAEGVEFHTTVTFESLGPRRTKLTLRAVFVTTAAHRAAVQTHGAIEGGKQTLERLGLELDRRKPKES
jgi:uncharacterized protein YndB with AHSA1/START domain